MARTSWSSPNDETVRSSDRRWRRSARRSRTWRTRRSGKRGRAGPGAGCRNGLRTTRWRGLRRQIGCSRARPNGGALRPGALRGLPGRGGQAKETRSVRGAGPRSHGDGQGPRSAGDGATEDGLRQRPGRDRGVDAEAALRGKRPVFSGKAYARSRDCPRARAGRGHAEAERLSRGGTVEEPAWSQIEVVSPG